MSMGLWGTHGTRDEQEVPVKLSLHLGIFELKDSTENPGRREKRQGAGRERRRPGPGSWLKGAGVAASSPVALILGPMVDSPSQLASPHSSSSPAATSFVLQGIDSIFLLSLERTSQATTWAKRVKR